MSKKELSSSNEDYLEAIYLLTEEEDEVGASDIASFLDVKLPSVSEMVRKLSEKGLVNYEKYGGISLTQRGEEIATEVSRRHDDLMSFLKLLGVNDESARIDACKVEHVLSQESVEKLRNFLKFVDEAPEKPTWLEHYKHFVKTGEHPECDRKDKQYR
ncbi:MAG: metal-dependent transcriptional regulator [Candidatus Hadarchaeia archaeon]